jgi:pyruvate kinase
VRGRNVAADVEEGDAELDDLEEIDVATDGLVVVRGFGVEIADWAGDDTGKFSVLFLQ